MLDLRTSNIIRNGVNRPPESENHIDKHFVRLFLLISFFSTLAFSCVISEYKSVAQAPTRGKQCQHKQRRHRSDKELGDRTLHCSKRHCKDSNSQVNFKCVELKWRRMLENRPEKWHSCIRRLVLAGNKRQRKQQPQPNWSFRGIFRKRIAASSQHESSNNAWEWRQPSCEQENVNPRIFDSFSASRTVSSDLAWRELTPNALQQPQ